MTPNRKHIIKVMLQGYYLRKWRNTRGVHCYRLYDAAGTPQANVPEKTIATLEKYIRKEETIFRHDKNGKITLNRANIRKLRKNHSIKILYLESKKK